MRLHQIPAQPPLWRRLAIPGILTLLTFAFSALGGPGLLGAAASEETALTRAQISDNRVALTFDVTWGQLQLQKLLAILDAHGAQATFFVGGTFLNSQAEAVRQLGARGHEVGTLGQKVIDLSGLSEQEVTSNLLASQSLLSKTLGSPVRYFRPPLGPATRSVVRGARAADLITVTFSLDAADHLGDQAGDLVKRVVRHTRRGDIIRLTASDWSEETARALPLILQGLQAKGLQPVTLSDLVVP